MKLKWLTRSKNFARSCAWASLVVLIGYGLIARAHSPKRTSTEEPTVPAWKSEGNVRVKASLSQTKVVQGSDGLVYLQVDLEAPEKASRNAEERKPTDFVVVLDRSGSMGDAKKMAYAHRAIESLIRQMNGNDRFAMVTFDDSVETPIELSYVSSPQKENLIARVNSITPRGSTNLGGGLLRGIQLVEASRQAGRADRLILLSDGLANVGVTDPQELNRIASRAVSGEFVISTIGVGLDFNENLMASLADYGAGNYHFLEDLASLEKVLSQEFYGASQVYARNLDLKLSLSEGVEVIDASGYPISREMGSVFVRPGLLYQGQKKTFFVTLKLPTQYTYYKPLGDATMRYDVEGRTYTASLFSPELKVACVSTERREEAVHSIVPGVYNQAWTQNNFGRFLKDNAEKVNKGDENGARDTIRAYKAKLSSAYQAAPSPTMKKQLDDLDKMESQVSGAFSSPDKETELKRLGKTYQYEGIQKQRTQSNQP
ncbi:MAG: VWA domain-containing protein [bacterium]